MGDKLLESLQEFSHALLELMEKVKQCKPLCISNPDIVLSDQFYGEITC